MPDSPTAWRYFAFYEPPSELHPETVRVWIGAMAGTCELVRVRVDVLPVFLWWVTPHQHGAGQPLHAPDASDYRNAYDYIRWKYSAVLGGIAGAAFSQVIISEETCVPCGSGSPPPCVFACTSITDRVDFGTSTFSGSENQAASIIGHELVHTVGWTNPNGECEAYTWELDHQTETGIDQDEGYLQDVQEKRTQACD
ncbi:MAG: hypothetical protein V2A79_19165 [Planctomycetota bacterium]